jgi:hypothetical protein
MNTIPESPTPLRVGVVSYTLALRHAARRLAAKRGAAQPEAIEREAVDAYRASGSVYDGKRALHRALDAAQTSGGGRRA